MTDIVRFYGSIKNVLSSNFYIITMVLAAIISLIRGFFIAGVLDVSEFGAYVLIIAAGTFLSLIVSLGENERSLKYFGRLWINSVSNRELIIEVDKSFKRMLTRSVVLYSIIIILYVTNFFGFSSYIDKAVLAVTVSLLVATSSLYSSAIRATSDINLLSNNTLLRALVVFMIGMLGAFISGVEGAILGELAGGILGVIFSRISLVKKTKSLDGLGVANSNLKFESNKMDSSGGCWLFLASLIGSFPVYLDRAFVAFFYGTSAVATYGFAMLFVTAANVFVGITAQKIAPHLILMESIGETINSQLNYAFKWTVSMWLVFITGMILVGLILLFGPVKFLYAKFNINCNLLLSITGLCLCQVSILADYLLISRNQEKLVFYSAWVYLFLVFLLLLPLIFLKLSLTAFMWILFIAKVCQLFVQLAFVKKLW